MRYVHLKNPSPREIEDNNLASQADSRSKEGIIYKYKRLYEWSANYRGITRTRGGSVFVGTPHPRIYILNETIRINH